MMRGSMINTGFFKAVFSSLLLALSACSSPEANKPGRDEAAESNPPAQEAASQRAPEAEDGISQLEAAANKAVEEQRIYAPAGNNAFEHYLALREKNPENPSVRHALEDLRAYLVIAVEQSIINADFTEARRLHALLARAYPSDPANGRLRAGIADAEVAKAKLDAEKSKLDAENLAKLEAENKRIAAEKLQKLEREKQELAARQAATKEQDTPKQTPRPAAPLETAPAIVPSPKPVAAAPAATQPPAEKSPSQPSASTELILISEVKPRYPSEALREGVSGFVEVEFVVGTDGSVTSARVLSAKPARTFDREALAAVKKSRFKPVSSPVTSRRRIDFNFK